MPAATAESPAVALSFANNFWGKEDAGVAPLIDRMVNAKQTCDELRSFYGARASIEEEYSKKLLNLAKKSLGSQETGTLKTSLDTVRAEIEAMGKQHQNIAAQMKIELEEPLAAFAGGMKERRKIVQNTVEKLLKTKVQQTQQVNKTRDKYEQECLKIKGYLAQGHMVMGQEERRNKAKLEKTQITLAASNTEYENAIKALEETTVRWNREWKAAADKFQDLEEERLDFTKGSLWTFANIASTVCVSDDSSCEKIRLSLENMDVETDIILFINDKGTGQEIPDAPKYINFCRGDINDGNSEASEDEHYSVAQFPRSINPAFRSSSPQPSTFESHHDPNSALANDLAHRTPVQTTAVQTASNTSLQKVQAKSPNKSPQPTRSSTDDPYRRAPPAAQLPSPYDAVQHASILQDVYPREGVPAQGQGGPPSDRGGSQPQSARPSSRDSHSEYSNPTSFSSQDIASGKISPSKQDIDPAGSPEKRVLKKKSGFLQNHSPFKRKSVKDMQAPSQTSRSSWHPSNPPASANPPRRHQPYNGKGDVYSGGMDPQPRHLLQERTASPEPIDANASLALGVGHNVLPVTTPDTQRRPGPGSAQRVDENDPIAAALAELKTGNVAKQSSIRMSADNFHGIPSAAQEAAMSRSFQGPGSHDMAATQRGTPPPSYQSQTQITRLGVPPPAVTSKAMKEATKKATIQARSIYGDGTRRDSVGSPSSPMSRPGTRGNDVAQPTSPGPARSVSPQPQQRRMSNEPRRMDHGSVSPNPYSGYHQRNSSQISLSQPRGSDHGYYRQASPHGSTRGSTRGASPSPYRDYNNRPQSSYGGSEMAVQLATGGDDRYGSSRSRTGRPESRAMGLYDGGYQRSKSVADPSRQYSRDGRPLIHMARAIYTYQAAIPEELGFAKGDYLAVYRHQDDGWWEAEVHGGNGQIGLVPSNYLQPC